MGPKYGLKRANIGKKHNFNTKTNEPLNNFFKEEFINARWK